LKPTLKLNIPQSLGKQKPKKGYIPSDIFVNNIYNGNEMSHRNLIKSHNGNSLLLHKYQQTIMIRIKCKEDKRWRRWYCHHEYEIWQI